MSARTNLAIVGGLVLIAAGGLWFLLQKDDAEATTQTASPSPPPLAGSDDTPTPVLRAPNKPSVTVNETPREPAGDPPKEYEVGGRKVRDHRTGDHGPVDIPPNVRPPEGRQIPSTLTSEIGQKVRAKVAECAALIPPEARGTKPRVEGLIVIAIKSKQVSISSATMQLREIVGAATDPTKQCIEERSKSITHPTDEADLETYDITVSFAL